MRTINDDDVQFYWLIVSADFEIDEDTHNLLLNNIVELLLTIRDFSLEGIWMEKYKHLSEKSTQCSKKFTLSLRVIVVYNGKSITGGSK